jgi:hypothetical protein
MRKIRLKNVRKTAKEQIYRALKVGEASAILKGREGGKEKNKKKENGRL